LRRKCFGAVGGLSSVRHQSRSGRSEQSAGGGSGV